MLCPGSSLCSPQSLHPRVEHGEGSPCEGLVCCSSRCCEVWKVPSAVSSAGWQWGGSGCWGVRHLHSPAPPRMLQNVWVPVAVLEWSLAVGSTDPAQLVDPVRAPLSGVKPLVFMIQKSET